MISDFKIFESIKNTLDLHTLTEISKIISSILNSRKYMKLAKDNYMESMSEGGCLMTYTVLYKLLKNYGGSEVCCC